MENIYKEVKIINDLEKLAENNEVFLVTGDNEMLFRLSKKYVGTLVFITNDDTKSIRNKKSK